MSAIPLSDLDQVATKTDMADLRLELKSDIAGLRGELKGDLLKLTLVLLAGFLAVIATLIGVG